MTALPNNNKGFTLIEILIAMAISGVVVGAIYTTYDSQQKTYVTQQQVVEMQQNLRAAAYLMDSEIRMAGYDPRSNPEAEIEAAGPESIIFSTYIGEETDAEDNDGDGEVDEADEAIRNVTYSLYDAYSDGDMDIGRKVGAGNNQPVAENVDALGFGYAFDDNKDGELDYVDTNGNGEHDAGEYVIWAIDSDGDGFLDTNLDTNGDGVIDINDATGGVGLVNQVDISNIRAVRIWVLARTKNKAKNFTDTRTYKIGDNLITPGGHFRRRLLTTNVTCRNLGLL
jgi:type IV pilus assembly protein PilW